MPAMHNTVAQASLACTGWDSQMRLAIIRIINFFMASLLGLSPLHKSSNLSPRRSAQRLAASRLAGATPNRFSHRAHRRLSNSILRAGLHIAQSLARHINRALG